MDNRKIFHSELFNDLIETEGFVISSFLSGKELQDLTKTVNELNKNADYTDVHIRTPFKLSAFSNNSDYKSTIYDKIYSLLKYRIDELLYHYEPLIINIFQKDPGDGAVTIHQNTSFVDEPKYKSLSIWIPLTDVNKENGTLGMLRGSHDVFDTIRAPNMPLVFDDFAKRLEDVYFEPIKTNAGTAVILDDSIVHWSYPNISDTTRTAVQLILVPKEAEHIYYYYNTSGTDTVIESYRVNKDFFFKFNCYERPTDLPLIRTFPFKYHNFSEEEMLKRVTPRSSFLQKLLGEEILQS